MFKAGFGDIDHHGSVTAAEVPIGGSCVEVSVNCVQELSPLDMMDLANGKADATGHRVWTGCSLFIEFLCRGRYFLKWLEGKDIVELGCGTGLGGIAAAASSNARKVLLTDGHPGVVALARSNVERNRACFGNTDVNVARLEWGDWSAISESECDVVLITDSIYDEDIVGVLMETAGRLLGCSRITSLSGEPVQPCSQMLCLAHVPRCADDLEVRACLNELNCYEESTYLLYTRSGNVYHLVRVVWASRVAGYLPPNFRPGKEPNTCVLARHFQCLLTSTRQYSLRAQILSC